LRAMWNDCLGGTISCWHWMIRVLIFALLNYHDVDFIDFLQYIFLNSISKYKCPEGLWNEQTIFILKPIIIYFVPTSYVGLKPWTSVQHISGFHCIMITFVWYLACALTLSQPYQKQTKKWCEIPTQNYFVC